MTVDEMLSRMSAQEYHRWCAYLSARNLHERDEADRASRVARMQAGMR